MNVYTLNVGQGQFVVITGQREAFIVDTFVPLNTEQETVFVKAALTKILHGKHLRGLIVTGFDADHFCEAGMKIVLNKYRPDWLMYPKYFKKTDTADKCFAAIKVLEGSKELTKHSIVLKDNNIRFYRALSDEFEFEVFSPHSADMTSSNNCSIVCRVREKSTRMTYLITGDTENDRWDSIVKTFGQSLKSDVLAAAHHGSEHGMTEAAMKLINPHTIIVSAGVDNQYGHPHASSKALFKKHSTAWYGTLHGKGQSLRTSIEPSEIKTFKFIC